MYDSSVNPIYFVFFTTATIVASAIMYRGWHTRGFVNTISLICGFLIIFSGVYLLDSIARKKGESLAIPPVTSTTSLHRRYGSKSVQSMHTTAALEEKDFQVVHMPFNTTCQRRPHRAFSV